MIKLLREWRRRRAIEKIRVAEEVWQRVEALLPFLDRLARPDRLRLREMAREFVASKEWNGARGLSLTPELQLSIALQACLPVLNLGLDWYRGWVGLVVYPGDFVIPRQTMDETGVVHEYDDEVLGEAWEGGPVLISWFDKREEAAGVNVVIHEFAHKLDMTNGAVDGLPALHEGMSRREWIETFEPPTKTSAGASTAARADDPTQRNPGEFSRYVEAFFETPKSCSRNTRRYMNNWALSIAKPHQRR
jgi:hypothetical protein